jgi:hypothetical protein
LQKFCFDWSSETAPVMFDTSCIATELVGFGCAPKFMPLLWSGTPHPLKAVAPQITAICVSFAVHLVIVHHRHVSPPRH